MKIPFWFFCALLIASHGFLVAGAEKPEHYYLDRIAKITSQKDFATSHFGVLFAQKMFKLKYRRALYEIIPKLSEKSWLQLKKAIAQLIITDSVFASDFFRCCVQAHYWKLIEEIFLCIDSRITMDPVIYAVNWSEVPKEDRSQFIKIMCSCLGKIIKHYEQSKTVVIQCPEDEIAQLIRVAHHKGFDDIVSTILCFTNQWCDISEGVVAHVCSLILQGKKSKFKCRQECDKFLLLAKQAACVKSHEQKMRVLTEVIFNDEALYEYLIQHAHYDLFMQDDKQANILSYIISTANQHEDVKLHCLKKILGGVSAKQKKKMLHPSKQPLVLECVCMLDAGESIFDYIIEQTDYCLLDSNDFSILIRLFVNKRIAEEKKAWFTKKFIDQAKKDDCVDELLMPGDYFLITFACRVGLPKVVSCILEEGFDVGVVDGGGNGLFMTLLYCSQFSEKQILDWITLICSKLKTQEAKMAFLNPSTKHKPAHQIALRGYWNVLDYLIEQRVPLWEYDQNCDSTLGSVILMGKIYGDKQDERERLDQFKKAVSTCKKEHDKKRIVNPSQGLSPLIIALINGYAVAVKYLCEQGISLTPKKVQKTITQLFFLKGTHERILQAIDMLVNTARSPSENLDKASQTYFLSNQKLYDFLSKQYNVNVLQAIKFNLAQKKVYFDPRVQKRYQSKKERDINTIAATIRRSIVRKK